MNLKEHIETIRSDAQRAMGRLSMEPDKTLRLISELCNVVEIQDEHIQTLEGLFVDRIPARTAAADEVEARHHIENDVTRRAMDEASREMRRKPKDK